MNKFQLMAIANKPDRDQQLSLGGSNHWFTQNLALPSHLVALSLSNCLLENQRISGECSDDDNTLLQSTNDDPAL